MQALIIVGHGSHLGAESSAPVYRHARMIRELGVFDEVRECFWKEEPSLREIFDLVEADEIYVVPLFISEGYFTGGVIPRELGLDGPGYSVTRRGGRSIHYCSPIGTHPAMTRLILRRAEEIAGLSGEEAKQAGLIILGHGTERNSNSAEVIYRVANEARETGVFGRVSVGFLDQAPRARAVLDDMTGSRVVLVPFFVAEGWHTQETIPDGLGINRPAVAAVTARGDQSIYYAAPVGTFSEIADIVLERAREAGAAIPRTPTRTPTRTALPRGQHAIRGMAAARSAFMHWVNEAGHSGRTFLQAHVRGISDDRYRLRHSADAERSPADLARYTDPYAAREIAQLTAAGDHRPLKTAPNLRAGWTFEDLDGYSLWTALDYLYPACATHWQAGREGSLLVTPWADTADRQSGIYAAVNQLSESTLDDAIQACCADAVCLRRVAWAASPDVGAPTGDAVVPCPEACSLFVSFARKVLMLERLPEREAGREPAYDIEARTVREGDFDQPTNERRLRYFAAKRGH